MNSVDEKKVYRIHLSYCIVLYNPIGKRFSVTQLKLPRTHFYLT